jgi:hypothetical protein
MEHPLFLSTTRFSSIELLLLPGPDEAGRHDIIDGS